MGTPDLLSVPTTVWLAFWANVATGLAFLYIPFEIFLWFHDRPENPKRSKYWFLNPFTSFQRMRPFYGAIYIAILFQVFIASCGLHHLYMAKAVWGHTFDLVQVILDLWLMSVSVFTCIILYHFRPDVRYLLNKIVRYYSEVYGETYDPT